MATIGLQMYSIRTVDEGDLLGKLGKVAAMGYDGVEFAGFEGLDAHTLRARLDEVGLVCLGSHTNIDLLRNDLEGQIEYHKILGARYINCPGARPENLEGTAQQQIDAWKALAAEFNEIGKRIAGAGMVFCYHNHSFEFEPVGDTCPEEIIFDNTDPAYVKVELDTCWIENTGRKSVDFMDQYADAMELLHIKELTSVGDPTAKVIGQGCIDFPTVIEKGWQVGVKALIVEHEGLEGDIMGDVKAGLDYLRSITE